jgi:hypothetical protein
MRLPNQPVRVVRTTFAIPVHAGVVPQQALGGFSFTDCSSTVSAIYAAPGHARDYGQECFWDCIDEHIAHGDTYGPNLHRYCENKCQISMPPQGLYGHPYLGAWYLR